MNYDLSEDDLTCAGCRRPVKDDDATLAWRDHSLQPHCAACLTEWLEATGRLTQNPGRPATTLTR